MVGDLRGRRAAPRGRTTPAQDVWLSFGCDEEVSGTAAPRGRRRTPRRGVRPWFVLDEGGAIAHQAFPGVEPPLGVIGVTEKGTTSVELVAEGRGGHASTPARNGPTARIAKAILRIEKSPFPASAPAPTLELLRRLAPHLPLPARPMLPNADRITPARHPGAARRRSRGRGDDPHHRRRHHPQRQPRAQRDRQQRPRRAEHPDHGRRHRRRRPGAPAQGDQGRQHPHRGRRAGGAVARSRRWTTPSG